MLILFGVEVMKKRLSTGHGMGRLCNPVTVSLCWRDQAKRARGESMAFAPCPRRGGQRQLLSFSMMQDTHSRVLIDYVTDRGNSMLTHMIGGSL